MPEPDERTSAIIASIFPPDATPDHCPRCGREPVLVHLETLSRYECRPWWRALLGSGPCCVGPYVFEGRQDGEYARRAAAGAWNRSVSAWSES